MGQSWRALGSVTPSGTRGSSLHSVHRANLDEEAVFCKKVSPYWHPIARRRRGVGGGGGGEGGGGAAHEVSNSVTPNMQTQAEEEEEELKSAKRYPREGTPGKHGGGGGMELENRARN